VGKVIKKKKEKVIGAAIAIFAGGVASIYEEFARTVNI
jgi:hypothetical protein